MFKSTGIMPAPALRLARLQPVLVHAHFGPDGVLAMPLARRLRVPLVVTFHGYDATTRDDYARRSFARHRLYLLRREALKRSAALFVAVSHFIRSRLLAQGFPRERVVVHYIGVDLDRFHGDPAACRESVVLFVGRLVEGKGAAHLLHAMALLRHRHPAFRIVVVGDGPERANLAGLAAELGVQAEFLGTRPAEEIAAWLRRAAILCVPSMTASDGWQEAFGIVFAEAQACGVPVVSYETGGIPEAVGADTGGLLVAEGDWRALAAALDRLLSDEQLRVKLGRAGQERTRTMFDLRRQTERLEALYRRVLAGWVATESSEIEPHGRSVAGV
jgi:glycosyltransferase involved in cell wall biosynthesis